MRRGEIWWVGLDPTQGREQQGRRPVLIVSPDGFNRLTRLPIVVPITSGGHFARATGFTVPLAGTGTHITGLIRCDQPRALDLAARNAERAERVPDAIIAEVLAKLTTLFA